MAVEEYERCCHFGGLLAMIEELQRSDYWRARLFRLTDRSERTEHYRNRWLQEIEKCQNEVDEICTAEEVRQIRIHPPISYADYDAPTFIDIVLQAAIDLKTLLTVPNLPPSDFEFIGHRLCEIDTHYVAVAIQSELDEILRRRGAGKDGFSPAIESPVALDPPTITVDGITYNIEYEIAVYLKELIATNGWMSGPEFIDKHPAFEGTRIDRLKKRIPEQVLKHIESERSKGSRWVA